MWDACLRRDTGAMHNPLRSIGRRGLILVGFAVAVLALGGSVAFARMMAPAPSDLDLSTQLPTTQQHFIVTYTPSVTPPPINQLHTWTVRVTTPGGVSRSGCAPQVRVSRVAQACCSAHWEAIDQLLWPP